MKLHKVAGIEHGSFDESHIIAKNEGTGVKLRIIDFTNAVKHKSNWEDKPEDCTCAWVDVIPPKVGNIRPYLETGWDTYMRCRELDIIEQEFEVYDWEQSVISLPSLDTDNHRSSCTDD